MSNFKSDLRMDLWCKRHNDNVTEFEYCAAFDVSADFTSQVTVNPEMRVILTISDLYLYFNSVIETKVGDLVVGLLNTSIGAVLATVMFIINNFLSNGLDLNWVMKDVLGIEFIYFKAFEMLEQEELLFVKLTPGWNITWNETTPMFNKYEP